MMFIVTKETLNALVTARVSAELAKHGVVVENLVLDDVTAGLEEKRIVKKLESKKKKEVEVTTATIDLFDELDNKEPASPPAEANKKAVTSAEQEQKEQAKLQKEQEKAAKEQAKQEKQALAEAKEQEKLAKKALADAKEQEKKALADAKEQEKKAKEQEKKAKEQEKLAKEQAKLAKEQEKAAKKALAEQKEQAKLLKEQAKAAKASPAVEKKDEEEEEDVVNKFEFMGTMYLKSKKTGQIYNMEQDPVGMWNEKTKKIDFDEETEEFEE